MPQERPLKEPKDKEKAPENPLRSGTASEEFLRRSGASIDEEDLSEGERRRGGQRSRRD